MLIELIKLVCKKYKHCNNVDICPFYDMTYGECPFEGPPSTWPPENEILKRLEENNNE